MSRDEDIVDYLLGELPPADRARFEREMGDDAGLREEVERMRPLVGDLDALPGEAWGGTPVPALPPLPPLASLDQRRAARRRLAVRPAVAVAASLATLAVGVAIGAVIANRGADAGPPIALARLGDASATAAGTARVVSSDGGALKLRVSGLAPSTRAQFYELWLLDGPTKAMSLGAFRVPSSGAASLTVPLPVSLTDFRFIDVSVEPEDGVATHSGRSVLRGATAT